MIKDEIRLSIFINIVNESLRVLFIMNKFFVLILIVKRNVLLNLEYLKEEKIRVYIN